MDKKTVFLFLSNRRLVSDLLHTDYIKYLGSKYKVVVFLTEDFQPESYFKNENIEYLTIARPKGKFWTIFDVFLRNELIRIFDNNPAVQWRNRRVTDSRRLFLRSISRFFPKNIFTPRLFTFLEKLLLPNDKFFLECVKKYKPALVLTVSPGLWQPDAFAVLSAKKAGIPTVAISCNWDNLTVYPRHVRKTDYLICWNDVQKEEAIKHHGYKEDEVFVSGAPHFDPYFIKSEGELSREKFLKNKGLDHNKKTIFFASQAVASFYRDFLNSFIDWRKRDKFFKDINLFVRIHPLDSMKVYEEFFNQPGIHIEYPSKLQEGNMGGQKIEMDKEDMVNTKLTVLHSDLCLNISSTMSIEAFIFDKPVINIGFEPSYSEILQWFHYKPLLTEKAVRVANSMEEVKKYIKMYLDNPALDQAGRRRIVQAMIKPTDGFSWKRNVDFLEKII